MSAIAAKVAAEHTDWGYGPADVGGWVVKCRDCNTVLGTDDGSDADRDDLLRRHVAEVTEAAVRAQIAANIEAARHQFVRVTGTVPSHPVVSAYDDAVRIAKGGAS